jgi:HEAT repeat protein
VSELYLEMRSIPKEPSIIKGRFKHFVKILNCLDLEIRNSQDDVDRLIEILKAPGGKIEWNGSVYWDVDPLRHRAAEELTRLKDVRAISGFLFTLNDPDTRLRGKSIFALGELGDQRAVPALIPLLGDRSLAGGRSAAGHAADALRKLDGEGIVEAFNAGLAGDVDALKGVARRHRIHIISAFLNLLRGSRHYSSAQAAVRGLVELGATEALPALRKEADRLGKKAAARRGLPAAIEALESRASLPRPAGAPTPPKDTLPRAATEPGPDTATLPRAVDDSDPEG